MAALMPRIERPVRLAAIMFGLLAALSAIVAALVAAFPDPRSPGMTPVNVFAFSLALYFLLTMLMVGVFLAFAGMRFRWLLLWGSFPLLAEAGYCVIVQSYIWFEGAEGWVTVVAHAAWPTVAIVLTWFAASGMVAIWGWIRYFRKLRLPKTAALNSPR